MSEQEKPIILSALRTPIGQFRGCFSSIEAPKLGAEVIKAIVNSNPALTDCVDQIIMGCVLSAGLGQAPARQSCLGAALPYSTHCTTINKMCGSGMQSVIFAHDAILSGSARVVIAGGFENMTLSPYLLKKARTGYRLGHDTLYDHMMLDGLEDAYTPGRPMGHFAEQCAKKYGFTREEQDQFAMESCSRALNAQKKSFFEDEICPVSVDIKGQEHSVIHDEGPQKTNTDKIPCLKPVFAKDGTITAANASSISDGAAALTIVSESFVQQKNLTGMARIIAHHTHAQEPEWFTTAPIFAIKSVLNKANWTLSEVDLFEINEAFAVVTMAAMRELELPHSKVNVNGGACILGHPIGASGARIIVTLVHALKQRGLKRGIAALCIGGGEATALAIELI